MSIVVNVDVLAAAEQNVSGCCSLGFSVWGSAPVWSGARAIHTLQSVLGVLQLGWSVFRHADLPVVVDTTVALQRVSANRPKCRC